MSLIVRWLAWRWLLLVAFVCSVALWLHGARWLEARRYMAEQLLITVQRAIWKRAVRKA